MNSPACKLPWKNLEINRSSINPCCNFAWTGRAPVTVAEYKNNQELILVKNQLSQGNLPAQCSRCITQENHTGHSLRTISNTFEPNDVVNEFENITILTSNTCNLKCTSCLNGSFVRNAEMYTMGLSKLPPIHVADTKKIDQLIGLPIKTLTLLGGEPFVDSTRDLLQQLVNRGQSQSIELRLSSNCTKITTEFLDFLATNFKGVLIKISIDGIGETNNYLRYPSKWNIIESNIDLISANPKIAYIVNPVLSNLGLLRMYELFQWCKNRSIKDVILSTLVDPKFMQCWLLPQPLLDSLAFKYQNLLDSDQWFDERIKTAIRACITACKSSNSDSISFTQSLEWYKLHDKHRKQNLFDVFPELIPYDC